MSRQEEVSDFDVWREELPDTLKQWLDKNDDKNNVVATLLYKVGCLTPDDLFRVCENVPAVREKLIELGLPEGSTGRMAKFYLAFHEGHHYLLNCSR